tara:strand:- start:14089 stop:19881 length:5793 start_codon:yes stop_codon:yes gene_type:complete
MDNKKSIGLPGGPNEYITDISEFISIEGYSNGSKDINNPVNIIESGSITMKDVDFPIMGTDNLGNEQIMMPGMNYQFPGDSVLEVPMAQTGLPEHLQGIDLTKINAENSSNINSEAYRNRLKTEYFNAHNIELSDVDLDNMVGDLNNQLTLGADDGTKAFYTQNVPDPNAAGFMMGGYGQIDEDGNQVNQRTAGYDWNNPTRGNIYVARNASQKAPFNEVDDEDGYVMPGTSMEESIIQHEVNHRLNSLEGSPLSSAKQSPLYDESYKYHNSFFGNAPDDSPFNTKFEDASFREYATQPFEIKSQKAQLEQALSNAGIWDPSKGPFTQADVDKMVERNITFNKGFGYLPRGLGVNELVEGTIKAPGKLTNPMNSYSEYIGDKFNNFLGKKGYEDFDTGYFYGDKDNSVMRNTSSRPFEQIKKNLNSVQKGSKKWNEWSDEIKTATTQYYNARGDSQGIKNVLEGEYPDEKTEALLLERGIKVGPEGWYEVEKDDQINAVLNEYQEITNTFKNTRDLISDKRPKEEGLFGAFGPIKNFKGKKAEREAVKRFNKAYKTDFKNWDDVVFSYEEGDVSQADKNIKKIVTETSVFDDIKTSFDREINTLQDLQKTGGHENRKAFYKNDFKLNGDFRKGRRAGKSEFNIDLANDYMNSLKNNPDTNKEGTDVFDNSYVPPNVFDNDAGYTYFDRKEGKELREQNRTNFKTAVDNDVWRDDLFTQAVLNLRANDRDAFIEYYNQDPDAKYTTKKEIKQQAKLLKQLKSSMPDVRNFLEKRRTETSNFIKDNNSQYEVDKEQQLINDNLSNENLNKKIAPNLIKFMNEVAMEDESMPTNLAKFGGDLPEAQRGNGDSLDSDLEREMKEVANWQYEAAQDVSSNVVGGLNNFYNKYISTPENDAIVKDILFNQVNTTAYPNVTAIAKAGFKHILGMEGSGPTYDKDGDYTVDYEAYAKALGYPTKNKYIVNSEYKPTISENPDAEYFKLNDDIINWSSLEDVMHPYDKGEDNTKPGKRKNIMTLSSFIKEDFMDPSDFAAIDPLQNFQLQWGYDEDKKQRYLSLIDKYDFREIESENIIKPFEFYDRHYIPNKKYGGSLPKAQEGTGFLDFLTNPIRKRLAENLYPVHYSGPAPHLTDPDFWEGNQSPEQKVLEAIKGNKENYLLQQHQDRRKYADQTMYHHALIERTDLLHLLMGQDQKHNSMSVSEYRPTKAKDKNITYYKSKVTEDYLRDLLNNVDYDNIHAKGDKDYGERYNNQNTSSSLATFQIDKGEDEKGKYISYYDIWDLDPFKKETFMSKVADKGQSLLGVTPPEIYGRIYIDDDKSVEPQSKVTIGGIKLKEKKHGGSLIELPIAQADATNVYQQNPNIPIAQEETVMPGSGIIYDPTSTSRNPNLQWMMGAQPGVTPGTSYADNVAIGYNELIGATTPIPILEGLQLTSKGARIPGLIDDGIIKPIFKGYKWMKSAVSSGSKTSSSGTKAADELDLEAMADRLDEMNAAFVKSTDPALSKAEKNAAAEIWAAENLDEIAAMNNLIEKNPKLKVSSEIRKKLNKAKKTGAFIGDGGSQIKKTDLEVYINPKTGEIEQFHSLKDGKVTAEDLEANLPWEIDWAGNINLDEYATLLKKIPSHSTPYKKDEFGFIKLDKDKVINYGPWKNQKGGEPAIQDNTFIATIPEVIIDQVSENNKKENQELGLSNILSYMVDTRGGTENLWTDLADNIAYHESGYEQRMDPKAIQRSNEYVDGKKTGNIVPGPGRGMFQFESKELNGSGSFTTAQKRYKNVAEATGLKLNENILNAKEATELSKQDQYTLFFANLIESKAVLKDYADGKLLTEDVWLKGHKNVSADGNKESFRSSVKNAEELPNGIENGYSEFTLEELLPYKNGGEYNIYKDYVNGKLNSKEGKKVYDKLNRVHYKEAKEAGMSPANYIMTNLMGHS